MSHDSLTFGMRQEYTVIAELLKNDFDVFQTLVDDKGIDCVVRLSSTKYLDIQIKARSKRTKYATQFSAMTVAPRPNYVFIFYTAVNDTFWVIPSQDVVRLGHRNKRGKNVGKYTLILPKSTDKPSKKYDRYKNNFGILRRGVKAATKGQIGMLPVSWGLSVTVPTSKIDKKAEKTKLDGKKLGNVSPKLQK